MSKFNIIRILTLPLCVVLSLFLSACETAELANRLLNNTSTPSNPIITNPSLEGFIDSRDSTFYPAVTIGSQTWMAANLQYDYGETYCYDDIPDNCSLLGRFYKWNTAMGIPEDDSSFTVPPEDLNQGICPDGWHIPSDSAWIALAEFIIEDQNIFYTDTTQKWRIAHHLKSKSGWERMQLKSLDTYGFWALPLGRLTTSGNYSYYNASYFWSSTIDSETVRPRVLSIYEAYLSITALNTTDYATIRCIKNGEKPIVFMDTHLEYTILDTSLAGHVVDTLKVLDPNKKPLQFSIEVNTNSDLFLISNSGVLSLKTPLSYTDMPYTVSILVSNGVHSITIPLTIKVQETMVDGRDGIVYPLAHINNKIWFAKNLNFDAGTGSTCYNEIPENCLQTGRFYTWYTAMQIDSAIPMNQWEDDDLFRKGVCPTGWHIPRSADWETTVLTIGNNDGFFSDSWDSAGAYLKAIDQWAPLSYSDHIFPAFDTYGFAAIPSGYKPHDGDWRSDTTESVWWGSTPISPGSNPGTYHITHNSNGIRKRYKYPDGLASVRCIYDGDSPAFKVLDHRIVVHTTEIPGTIIDTVLATDANGDPLTYTITNGNSMDIFAVDNMTGHISIAQTLTKEHAGEYELTVKADDGKHFNSVILTISLQWSFIDERDQQSYAQTQIANRIWMAQNLNYSDTATNLLCQRDSLTNCSSDGEAYNWTTALNLTDLDTLMPGKAHSIQGICPSGWHIPSQNEWRSLLDSIEVITNNTDDQETTWTSIAPHLKGNLNWDSLNNLNNSNLFGFSAHKPQDKGTGTSWWSSTISEDKNAYSYNIFESSYAVSESKSYLHNKKPIRCVQNDSLLRFNYEEYFYSLYDLYPANTAIGTIQALYDGSNTVLYVIESGNSTDLFSIDPESGLLQTARDIVPSDQTLQLITISASIQSQKVLIPINVTIQKSIQDLRDNTYYTVTTIGDQTWFAENLRYAIPNQDQHCYTESIASCIQFGPLYPWAEAMALDASFNTTLWDGASVNHQGICPDGWHIPTNDEFLELSQYIALEQGIETLDKDGRPVVENFLWEENKTNDPLFKANPYNFSAIGKGYNGKSTQVQSQSTIFWSTTENDESKAGALYLAPVYQWEWDVMSKGSEGSIRCLLNN